MRKLYEISDEMVALLDQVDPETGELPEQLSVVTADFKSKGQNVVAYTLNLDSSIAQKKELIKKLQASIKADEGRIASLKGYLQFNMDKTGVLEIVANDGSFKARLHRERDASVDVFDERQLPELYLREIPAKYEPDKKLIKQAIDDGFDVPGAKVVKRDRLTIT